MGRAEGWSWLGLAVLGCAGSPADSPSPGAPSAAAASQLAIERTLIAELGRARGIDEERALELATEDALLARELERDAPELARYVKSLALARALLEELRRQVRAEQPVTDAEIDARARERWWELERPRMVRVVHALVHSGSESAAAREVAERVRAAVLSAEDAAAFRRSAEAVDARDLKLSVEKLPPLAADGRSVELSRPPPEGPPVRAMAAAFAEAAARLERPGDVSPVVQTSFGYHVIRLLEVIEPQRSSIAERRALLEPEIVGERARERTAELLERLRRELSPEQARNALSAMELVRSVP